MQTPSRFSQPLDPVEISLLEQELRGQAQAAAVKALGRAIARLVTKVRHSVGNPATPDALRSA
jgi:hypothetical protein